MPEKNICTSRRRQAEVEGWGGGGRIRLDGPLVDSKAQNTGSDAPVRDRTVVLGFTRA